MSIEKSSIIESEGKKPETLGWNEIIALRVLANADKLLDQEKQLGELKKIPDKVTEIPDSLFRNEKGELVPFRKKEVVFIPSKDEKGHPVRIFCIGDLHSDARGVKRVVEEFDKALKEGENAYLITLGDYVDRPDKEAKKFEESEQLDCFHRIIQKKLSCPDRVVTLAGNHEEADTNFVNGLRQEMQNISSHETWKEYNQTFAKLPRVALLVDQDPKKCNVFTHGGIPYKTIDNLPDLVENSQDKGFLWADPAHIDYNFDEKGFFSNLHRLPRDIDDKERQKCKKEGYAIFNEKALDRFLAGIGSNGKLVRGHEYLQAGFKKDLSDKVITIFSANRYGSGTEGKFQGKYLDYNSADNSFEFRNLDEISPVIKAQPEKPTEEKLPDRVQKYLEIYNDALASEHPGQWDKRLIEAGFKIKRISRSDVAMMIDTFDYSETGRAEIMEDPGGLLLCVEEDKKLYIMPLQGCHLTSNRKVYASFFNMPDPKNTDGGFDKVVQPAVAEIVSDVGSFRDVSINKLRILQKGEVKYVKEKLTPEQENRLKFTQHLEHWLKHPNNFKSYEQFLFKAAGAYQDLPRTVKLTPTELKILTIYKSNETMSFDQKELEELTNLLPHFISDNLRLVSAQVSQEEKAAIKGIINKLSTGKVKVLLTPSEKGLIEKYGFSREILKSVPESQKKQETPIKEKPSESPQVIEETSSPEREKIIQPTEIESLPSKIQECLKTYNKIIDGKDKVNKIKNLKEFFKEKEISYQIIGIRGLVSMIDDLVYPEFSYREDPTGFVIAIEENNQLYILPIPGLPFLGLQKTTQHFFQLPSPGFHIAEKYFRKVKMPAIALPLPHSRMRMLTRGQIDWE